MKMSSQALSAILMTLQKGILERKDITDILRNLNFESSQDGLVVTNPPTFHVSNEPEEDDLEAFKDYQKE